MAKQVKAVLEKEEKVLARAVGQTMKNYSDNATVKNLRAMEAAKKGFSDFQNRKAAEADPEARCFAVLTSDVLEYLKGEGFKIEKSKLSADRHKINKQENGSYSKKDVDAYARLCLQRRDGSDDNISDAARRKADLEVDILEERKKEFQRENEIAAGKWLLKSDVEQKHTANLALLMNAVNNFIHGGKLEEAVEIVGGGKEKVTEFKTFFKKEFRALLGEYAKKPEFAVSKQSMSEAGELIADANRS